MAELAPCHVGVQVLRTKLEARRKALDDSRQARAMRFPSSREADASHDLNLQAAHEIAVERANDAENQAWQGSRLGTVLCTARADDAARRRFAGVAPAAIYSPPSAKN
jgi:hypothetical protein